MQKLFDLNSSSHESDVFIVPSFGGGVLLSMYNAPPETCVTFEKVMVGSIDISSSSSCNRRDKHTRPIIEFAEPVRQAGNWMIEADNNTGVMVLPGIYRAVTNPDYVGSFVLTATDITQEAVQNVPSHLRYGWINSPILEN